MKVGAEISLRGYVTKAHWLRSKSPGEVEALVGYREGRLRDGWTLLFLLQLPSAAEFEFRGHSYMSGGIIRGHLAGASSRPNAEQRLIADGIDIARLKAGIIQNVFRTSGSNRLAKVIPIADPHGQNDYPVGRGVEQWELVRALPFKVAARMGPGETYSGLYE